MKKIVLLFILIGFLTGARLSFSQNYFMNIENPGIEGESQTNNYENQIDLTDFSFSITNNFSFHSLKTSVTGKVVSTPVNVEFLLNKAGSEILTSLHKGRHHGKITISVLQTGAESPQEYLVYEFEDIVFTSFTTKNTENEILVSASFKPSTFRIKLRPTLQDGSLGTEVNKGWNLETNQALTTSP